MSNFKDMIRWEEWGDSKLPFVVIAWLLVSLKNPNNPADFGVLLRAIGFGSCYLAFGYMFNDWMDRELDIKVGKLKPIHRLQSWQIISVLLVLILAGVICVLSWLTNPIVLATILLCYFFAITYSALPLRFKERGEIGILVASLSQRTLLTSLIILNIGGFGVLAVVYLFLTLVIGIRWMLTHQIDDHAKDQLGQVNTFTVRRGVDFSVKQLVWLFNLEIMLLIFLAFDLSSAFIWVVYFAYIVLTFFMSKAFSDTPWQMLHTPSTAYLVLADFYFFYWPLGLAIVYGFYQPISWVVVIFLSILLLRYVRQHFEALLWLFSRLREVHQ